MIRLTKIQSILYVSIAVLIMMSCTGTPKDKESKKETEQVKPPKTNFIKLEPAVIHEHIAINNDSANMVSVYLPSGYKEGNTYPAIIFFDPHARARLPLELYASLADKYQCILVASERFKNGLKNDEIASYGGNIISYLPELFPVDRNKIITAGFSGGARAASGLAVSRYDVAGVIACGAGFPGNAKALNVRILFLGVIGLKDMNYGEMKNIDQQLTEAGINHFILEFEGEHDWPSVNVMDEAFFFHYIDGLNLKKVNPIRDSIVSAYFKQQQAQLDNYLKANNSYFAGLTLRKLQHMALYLADSNMFPQSYRKLLNDKKIMEAEATNKTLLQEEAEQQQAFNKTLGYKDLAWWEKETNKYKRKVRQSAYLESSMNQRLLNYLSLVSNLQSTRFLDDNKLDGAAYFLDLYKMVDPDNKDAFYLSALYFAKKNQKNMALGYLKKSVELGYSDRERLWKQQAFMPYHDDPDFKALLPE